MLREVSAFEEEIFTRAQRREDGRARADAARKVANGGVAEAGAFGRLFPPTEKRQQQLHDAIAAYAGGARSGVAAPMTLPSMSGEAPRGCEVPLTPTPELAVRSPKCIRTLSALPVTSEPLR